MKIVLSNLHHEEQLGYSMIKKYGNKCYRFINKNTFDETYLFISSESYEYASDDYVCILMRSTIDGTLYAILEIFHKGVWLTKIIELDESYLTSDNKLITWKYANSEFNSDEEK